MSEKKITPQAKETYDTVCRYFDGKNWSYEKKDEELFASLRVKGDDMPITLNFVVDAERNVLRVTSPMPFKIDMEKVGEFSFALTAVANAIYNGWFIYDIEKGTLVFRVMAPFMGSSLSEEMVEYLLNVAYSTVNNLNDRFHALSKGMITVEQFLDTMQQ